MRTDEAGALRLHPLEKLGDRAEFASCDAPPAKVLGPVENVEEGARASHEVLGL